MSIQEIDDLVSWIKTNILETNPRNKYADYIIPKENEHTADALLSESVDLSLVHLTEPSITEEQELSLIEFIIGADTVDI